MHIWYNTKVFMRTKSKFVIGRHGFSKISAVEGITLDKRIAKMFETYDKQGLSPAKRRESLHSFFKNSR